MKGLIVLSAGHKVSFEVNLRRGGWGGGGVGGGCTREGSISQANKNFRFESEVDAHVTIFFLAEIMRLKRLLLPLSSLPIAK